MKPAHEASQDGQDGQHLHLGFGIFSGPRYMRVSSVVLVNLNDTWRRAQHVRVKIMNMNASWQNVIVHSPWRLRARWSPAGHRFHGRQGARSGNPLSCKMECRHKSLHKFFSKSAKQGLFLLGQVSRTGLYNEMTSRFGAWMSYLLGNICNIFDCCRTNTLSCTP